MKIKSLSLILLILFICADLLHSQTGIFAEDVEAGIEEHLDEIIPGDIMLVNETGKLVSLEEMVDKPTIVNLVYYRCPGICSPIMEAIADVIDKMDLTLGDDFQVLTISFDPTESIDLPNTNDSGNNNLFVFNIFISQNFLNLFNQQPTNLMPEPSTKSIVEGLAASKTRIIRYIYKTYYRDIKRLILMNKGSEEDAQDTFQEALYFIYQKIKLHDLTLTGSFGGYLYSVCKLLWLKELRERAYKDYQQWYTGDIPAPSPVNKKLEAVKLKIFDRHFNELSEECQKILNMHFREISLEKIAEVMGYSSLQQVKEKKYKCKKSLMNKIFNNPEYKKVSDEIYLVS